MIPSYFDCASHSVTLLILFLEISSLDLAQSVLQCHKTSPCSCQFATGSIIDLSRIETLNISPKFNAILGKDQNLYFYNPCSDFSLKSVENCTDAAVCVYKNRDRQYAMLGTVESAEFVTDELGRVAIIYQRVTETALLTTKVHLNCSKSGSRLSQLEPLGSYENQTLYNMTLTSRCACADGCRLPSGLSTGSILLILAACGVLVYLVVGVAYNRSLGARGVYMLPNYVFWADFPALVKDGYWYFLSPCIGDRVEYRYYERL